MTVGMRLQSRRAALDGLIGLAEELGADGPRLRGMIGQGEAGEPPPNAFQAALGLAARETGRDDFGLLLARRRNLETLGQLAPLLESAPRVGDALDQFFHLLPHSQEGGVRAHIERNGEDAMLVGQVVLAAPPALDQQVDHLAGAAVGLVRRLTSPDWVPEAVYLTRRRPAAAASYEAFFGAPVLFEQEVSGIAIRSRLLDQPIVAGNVERNRLLYAELQDKAAVSGQGFSELVRDRIWRGLGDRWRGEAGIAADLGLPRRTFQRRLAREGAQFSAMVAEARLAIATRLMVHTHASLTEISDALGFAEPAVFCRFFRRLTGSSARQWRAARRHAPPPVVIGVGEGAPGAG